jgi:hypothetical protein
MMPAKSTGQLESCKDGEMKTKHGFDCKLALTQVVEQLTSNAARNDLHVSSELLLSTHWK